MPLFIIAVLILAVDISAGDEAWLRREYEKLDISRQTGMDTETMTAGFMCLSDFMKGETDSLDMTVNINGTEREMFGEREKLHMNDVRTLYSGFMTLKTVFLFFTLAAVIFSAVMYRRAAVRMTAKAFLYSFAGILALFLIIILLASIDFDCFWRLFHIIFLDVESSTFDPAQSLMIQICPLNLFRDMAGKSALRGILMNSVFAAASAVYLTMQKRQKRNLKTAQQNIK